MRSKYVFFLSKVVPICINTVQTMKFIFYPSLKLMFRLICLLLQTFLCAVNERFSLMNRCYTSNSTWFYIFKDCHHFSLSSYRPNCCLCLYLTSDLPCFYSFIYERESNKTLKSFRNFFKLKVCDQNTGWAKSP